jgi:two-component system chemotaxis response regulator CheY
LLTGLRFEAAYVADRRTLVWARFRSCAQRAFALRKFPRDVSFVVPWEESMLRKILAVDDSALIHQMYKLFLSRYKNCKLISAMNGLEALDKLGQEEGIDLILLDINMPVMNGLEFLQRVQKEPAYQGIPVIIISTEGKEEDTIRGLKMGAKGYVKKPFQASELHGLIEKITAGAPS